MGLRYTFGAIYRNILFTFVNGRGIGDFKPVCFPRGRGVSLTLIQL